MYGGRAAQRNQGNQEGTWKTWQCNRKDQIKKMSRVFQKASFYLHIQPHLWSLTPSWRAGDYDKPSVSCTSVYTVTPPWVLLFCHGPFRPFLSSLYFLQNPFQRALSLPLHCSLYTVTLIVLYLLSRYPYTWFVCLILSSTIKVGKFAMCDYHPTIQHHYLLYNRNLVVATMNFCQMHKYSNLPDTFLLPRFPVTVCQSPLQVFQPFVKHGLSTFPSNNGDVLLFTSSSDVHLQ